MRNLFRAILRSLGRMLKFVWDPVKKVGSWVKDTSIQVVDIAGDIAGTAATAVGKIPAGLLSGFSQRVAPAPTNEQPVAKAKADNKVATEEQRVVEAVRASANASVDHATLVRRFATAVVDGKTTPSLASLPDEIRHWLVNLRDAQLTLLSEQDFAACQRHLSGSVPLAGVPTVGSLAVKEPEPVAPSAEVIRPQFGGIPKGGYSAAAAAANMAVVDQAALDAEAAAMRAERMRLFDMQPLEQLAKKMAFFERSKAYDRPKVLPLEPAPAPAPEARVPMAMSSFR